MPKDLTFDVQIALISLLVYNSPLGRSRLRWEDNIKMDLQEMGLGVAWTGFIWLRKGAGGEHL